MRVTRENLVRIARETSQKESFSDSSIVAAYLTGSLRGENPFIGNTTDIDIVFVHDRPLPASRQIIPLSPEITLDILHNPRSQYDKPKALRVDPWLGPELYDPLPLYGTQHFFEFVQAGVRDKFNEPDSFILRSRSLAAEARQRWSSLQLSEPGGPDWLLDYLNCLYLAANAVALLAGPPIAERRLLLEFPARAEAAGLPGLVTDLFHLAGAGVVDVPTLTGLLPDWESAFVAAGTLPAADRRIVTARLRYYKLAFEDILAGDAPQSVLWPLLLTWTLSVSVLPELWLEHWRAACTRLGLAGPELDNKIGDLDHFLDALEETLENRSVGQGL
jgi:hypothetical protein